MKIWYNKQIIVRETPEGTSIQLEGIYNDPTSGEPTIQIVLKINENAETIERTLFTRNLSVPPHEDPNPDDILAKFANKISKILGKLSNKNYKDIKEVKVN